MPKVLAATRHFRLAQQLRQSIRNMAVGEALPTVAELRAQYGCSQATVERALDRIRREGLVVRPAGQLRLTVAEASDPAAYRVTVIRPDYPSPTYEELTRVIVDAGKKRDWAFDVESYRSLEGLELNRAIGDNDGAVLLPTSEEFPEHLINALKRPTRPLVLIQDPPAGLRVSSVRIDDEQVGRLAVEHLAALGHRRILLLISEPPSPSGNLRAAGWRGAMGKLGEASLDELVADAQLKPFDNTLMGTYHFFCRWLERKHAGFTAVFCPAWTGALAAMRALREHGMSVPKEVSVVAHGGEGYIAPFLLPSLTAVETDIALYGQRVVEVLAEQLRGGAKNRHITMQSQVVARDSTAAPGRILLAD